MKSSMPGPDNSPDTRRKKIIWRAEHRGIREMDLLMGSFARQYVNEMDESELDAFEVLIGLHDLDLYNWLIGREEAPDDVRTAVYERLKQHQLKPGGEEP